ncbi:DUF2624 domain-containing protein [Oceanobacillus bengalensis]|uniref:DUF2624 domain-containing protein n=1 Tax=Oceanobacillus bengalensis TaxID=1435466 RepID=A0A494Z5K5_9BACI|nr:DUF2624 domain-containing protein [Oceanobacillus bengalensis]RKQ17831.1 DUF2624 domain-containing protein [Oceanobacillus bengalensis]
MSFIIKELVKNKLKQISANELLQYGKQYGFTLSQNQASEITHFLRNNTLDPFQTKDREEMFRKLAEITDIETAKQARKLLDEIIKSYGLAYLFE